MFATAEALRAEILRDANRAEAYWRRVERVATGCFIKYFQQLVVYRLGFFGDPFRVPPSAVAQMIAHQFSPDAAQRFLYRRDLRQDIDAIAIFFHGPL